MNRFNLVDEKWIPVANEGLVSLADIFTKKYSALGGNPIQKIALTKLLLAIAQAAHTPKDNEEWKKLNSKGMSEKTMAYLQSKKDCFWLYGKHPFLQMLVIEKAAIQPYGAVSIGIAIGNTTVLMQSQIEKPLSDAAKALLVVELGGFALSGKKTDNSIVLSEGYMGKSNEKGKPSSGKAGASMGFMGFLHSFLISNSITETLYLNLITLEQILSTAHLSSGLGVAPWEKMPAGECCPIAEELKKSYLGRLVPICRFVLLTDKGIHYSEGLSYPSYDSGGYDLSTGVDFSAIKARACWADTEKKPWRQLISLLSFLTNEKKGSFDCCQLRYGLSRVRGYIEKVGIWSGGLRVSSNAGEQYASGTDDFVESEFRIESAWLGEPWFFQLKTEMTVLDDISKNIYGCTLGFFKQQLSEGKAQAAQASNLFWQLAEPHFQALLEACGNNTTEKMRGEFVRIAYKAYNTYCHKDTARQLDAWAANRPQLGKYFKIIEINDIQKGA